MAFQHEECRQLVPWLRFAKRFRRDVRRCASVQCVRRVYRREARLTFAVLEASDASSRAFQDRFLPRRCRALILDPKPVKTLLARLGRGLDGVDESLGARDLGSLIASAERLQGVATRARRIKEATDADRSRALKRCRA